MKNVASYAGDHKSSPVLQRGFNFHSGMFSGKQCLVILCTYGCDFVRMT